MHDDRVEGASIPGSKTNFTIQFRRTRNVEFFNLISFWSILYSFLWKRRHGRCMNETRCLEWIKKRTITPFRHGWCVLIICSQVPLVNGVFMQRLTPSTLFQLDSAHKSLHISWGKDSEMFSSLSWDDLCSRLQLNFIRSLTYGACKVFSSLLIHFTVLHCCFFMKWRK